MRVFTAICKEKYREYKAIIKRVAALAVMIVVTVGSVVTVMAATHTAHVDRDGVKKDVEITDPGTEAILLKAGVRVAPGDEVTRTEDPSEAGDVFLTVRTGRTVSVDADGAVETVAAHYGDTVGDALDAAGVEVDADDELTPPAPSAALDGMTVKVRRRCSITVNADGKTVAALVHQGTVSAALKEAGISLAPSDRLSADAEDRISDGMSISVIRVLQRETTETQPVAFKTVKVSDPTLSSGKTKVKTDGKNGVKTIVKSETLTDGKVAESKVVSESVTQTPVDRVVLVGTKSAETKRSAAASATSAAGTFVDRDGNTVKYRKYFTGRCTAYTGGGTTSTGKPAAVGLVAVNPSLIPYGTRLYIASPDGKTVYGYAVAADTGGGAKSGRILADLYYNTLNQCVNFGVRNMRIYIL
jgi:uncharacterized protein YabE (DUF348 family)/3D (Asp-Asp-Asp) domain-containing protein